LFIYAFIPYILFGAYPNHMHITVIVKKQLVGRKEKHNSTDRD
jgi:hypothetical protein